MDERYSKETGIIMAAMYSCFDIDGAMLQIPLSMVDWRFRFDSFFVVCLYGVFILFYSSANLYMILINGTSKVRLQLIVNLCFAVISLPSIHAFCHLWGIQGALLVPTMTLAVLTLIGKSK